MDPRRQEIYISTDVEFDGKDPGSNSMRSIGAVAYRANGQELSRFYANLEPLPDHAPSKQTMESFWQKPEQQKAWEALQDNPREAGEVMQDFTDWVKGFTGKPILVAQPLKIEERWLNSYFERFNIESPFEGAICMREMLEKAIGMMKKDDIDPQSWLSQHPYTHIAIDDAINQGETFINMKKWMDEQSQQQGHGR